MRNINLAKVGTAAFVLGAACMAAAQSPTGISARIGGFVPTSDGIGGTWFGLGLDYRLNSLPATIPGSGTAAYWGLSADWYTHGSDSNIPIVINYNLKSNGFTYSIGAGVEFYDVPGFSSSTGTGWDGQLGVAYEFGSLPTPVFVQVKYFLSGKSDLDGFGLYAGVHF